MKHISKAEREKQRVQQQRTLEAAERILQFSKKRFKKFDEIIESLYQGEDLGDYFSDRRIWKINECFQRLSSKIKAKERVVLKDTLLQLNRFSLVLSTEENIEAVFNIVKFRAYWIKEIEHWQPSARQAETQVKQLAEWLFCKYRMPGFLYKAFYDGERTSFIYWFIHIGTGGRVKDLKDIPITFTQKMAHYFLQAPSKFSIGEALRWAQVKGLGGNDSLAERIVYSWIGAKPYGDEDFWASFLQLVSNAGMLSHEKMVEIIDYVREEKRLNRLYTLKGRTIQSLMRQSDEWHNRFAHNKHNSFWKPCGIVGYREERKKELIVIEELTESAALKQEGKTMKHCVGSYAYYCAKGRTAVFSLRKLSGGFIQDTMATIEVNLQLKRIVQAKAKMNRPINEEAVKYMAEWAGKQALSISPYL